MKCLTIQIQPERDSSQEFATFIEYSRKLGRFPEVDINPDEGPQVYLNYFSEQLPLLWADLQQGIYQDPTIGSWAKRVSVVVCEGDKGWQDSLLLHHFDSGEMLDTL